MNNLTIALIKAIEDREITRPVPLLIEHAKKNKVLLEFLRKNNIYNNLRLVQEKKWRKFISYLSMISVALEDINYAVIKYIKPVSYVPTDIDILIDEKDLKKGMIALKKIGFKVIVFEKHCISLVKNSVVVDLYIDPDIGNVPYLSGAELLNYVDNCNFLGIKTKKLINAVEAVLTAAHAIYKEQIFTLNDYFTIKSYFSPISIKVARKLKVSDALTYSLRLTKAIDSGKIETPIKLSFFESARFFLKKILYDEISRRNLPYILYKFMDVRLPILIKFRVQRDTY